MTRFLWDSLRIGDKVLVHDDQVGDAQLRPGVVTGLNVRGRRHDLGIRISRGANDVILWPSPLTVHFDPLEAHEPCWRCDALAAVA